MEGGFCRKSLGPSCGPWVTFAITPLTWRKGERKQSSKDREASSVRGFIVAPRLQDLQYKTQGWRCFYKMNMRPSGLDGFLHQMTLGAHVPATRAV